MRVCPPLVSMNTPRPASRRQPTSARSSASSARREGIGLPPSPLCAGEVLVEKPIAPACIASRISARIATISSRVAARSVAASPIT